MCKTKRTVTLEQAVIGLESGRVVIDPVDGGYRPMNRTEVRMAQREQRRRERIRATERIHLAATKPTYFRSHSWWA